jgi:hypothetical protein
LLLLFLNFVISLIWQEVVDRQLYVLYRSTKYVSSTRVLRNIQYCKVLYERGNSDRLRRVYFTLDVTIRVSCTYCTRVRTCSTKNTHTSYLVVHLDFSSSNTTVQVLYWYHVQYSYSKIKGPKMGKWLGKHVFPDPYPYITIFNLSTSLQVLQYGTNSWGRCTNTYCSRSLRILSLKQSCWEFYGNSFGSR